MAEDCSSCNRACRRCSVTWIDWIDRSSYPLTPGMAVSRIRSKIKLLINLKNETAQSSWLVTAGNPAIDRCSYGGENSIPLSLRLGRHRPRFDARARHGHRDRRKSREQDLRRSRRCAHCRFERFDAASHRVSASREESILRKRLYRRQDFSDRLQQSAEAAIGRASSNSSGWKASSHIDSSAERASTGDVSVRRWKSDRRSRWSG